MQDNIRWTSRPYETDNDLDQMLDLLMQARAQTDDWRYPHVGDLLFWFLMVDCHLDFMRLPGYHADLDVFAIAPDGIIAAYVNGWIDPLNKIGDFGPVGARPAYRRQGLSRAVLLECLRRMQALGMNRVSVSTGISNTPAIRLYESVGFKIVNQTIEYVKAG